MKAHNVKGDKERIAQLENSVVKQTVEYTKEVERIKEEMKVSCIVYQKSCVYVYKLENRKFWL